MTQETRTTLKSGINADVADGGQNTAADVRTQLLDLADSAFILSTDTADNITEGATNKFFTTEAAQDAVGAAFDTTLVYTDGSNSMGRAAISGDVVISAGSNTAAIGTGVIVNADVNASAAIATSKLAALTANRLAITDGSGFITNNTVTATEAGYLSGVTSAIQTQLGTKQGTITLTTTGSSGAATLIGNTLNIPQYTGGGGGTISSVNGDTGPAVVLDTDDIGEGSTNLYFTTERAQDSVGAAFDSTLVYTDGSNSMGRAGITGDLAIAAGSNTSVLVAVNANVGSFGSATQVGTFTVNAKGLVTAAGNTSIAITSGGVTDFVEAAQDAVGAMVDSTLVYTDGTPLLSRAAISGDITMSAGSNTSAITAGVIVNADINGSAAIDATKIADGSVTSTEFQYINTLSSNAQTQLNGKVNGTTTITVGTSAPGSPATGDLWVDTN